MRGWIIGAGCLCAGCLSSHRAVVITTPIRGWGEGVEVVLSNTDTVTPHDLYLILRYNDLFRSDTLALTVRTETPDSLVYEEPFTGILPRIPHPAALGSEASILYRRAVVLPRTGDYRLTFTPSAPIDGIEAIGIDYGKR